MVTSFDISQEIISIYMLTALKSSLKHRRKHVLRSLQLYGDQALQSVVYKIHSLSADLNKKFVQRSVNGI